MSELQLVIEGDGTRAGTRVFLEDAAGVRHTLPAINGVSWSMAHGEPTGASVTLQLRPGGAVVINIAPGKRHPPLAVLPTGPLGITLAARAESEQR